MLAELELKTSRVIGQLHRRHRSQEFRKFLDTIEANVPAELEIHIVLDNYGTHKTAIIRNWFAKWPRFHIHFPPTYGAWLTWWNAGLRKLPTSGFGGLSFRSVKET